MPVNKPLQLSPGTTTMNIIAIANQKGGVGKTTTAVNLSACLAAKGKHVLLIDLDPQGNATSALGVENPEGKGLYAPLLGAAPLEENIIATRLDNLYIVPADMDLAGAEVEVARMENHLTRLREVIKALRTDPHFDFVFLDCPPSLGILMTNALAAAEGLFIPIQCEYFALEGLSKIVQVIEHIRQSGANPQLRIDGILMTMYDARTNLSQQVVEEVRGHFPAETFQTVIPRNIRLGEAPSFGRAIIEYDPRSAGAVAYESAAIEFLQRRGGGIQFINITAPESAVTISHTGSDTTTLD